MKILIVDDDRAFRGLLFELLNPEHDVSVLCDGYNAISLLADPKHNFDLVILDIRMPRCNGDEVLRALEDWQNLKSRFVIVSGNVDPKRFRHLKNVAGVFAKPFDLGVFVKWVREHAPKPGLSPALALA